MRTLLHKMRTVEVNLSVFVITLCLFNIVVFQWPLLSYAISISDFSQKSGYIQILSLQVLQTTLLAAFLFLLATISAAVMKYTAAILILCNSAAYYFMIQYGVEIDKSMIANVFNTDTREATELLHPIFVLYVFGLGIVPSFIILCVLIRSPQRIWRFGYAVASVIILSAWVVSTSFTFLWYDLHSARLGGKVLPWSYIANTAEYLNQSALARRKQELLPNAIFTNKNSEQKEVVVLVLGESLRADNLSLLGYNRETNPYTKYLDLAVFPIGQACSTNTLSSAACILTHEGREASQRTNFEPLPSYLTRHGVETIFRTNNSGTPPFQVDTHQTAKQLFENCKGADCPNEIRDGLLNIDLKQLLADSKSRRIFILLHQTGSHGPAYYKKYPKEFEHFTPTCRTVQVAECTQQELLNAYDNTIRYTDSILADIIGQLAEVPNTNSVMIFVSDHGQSLGEGGFYLHAAPLAIAPPEQLRVPFLVWMSDGFKAARGLESTDVLHNDTYPHDFPFHSVMGAFGLRSDIYKPQYDVFNVE